MSALLARTASLGPWRITLRSAMLGEQRIYGLVAELQLGGELRPILRHVTLRDTEALRVWRIWIAAISRCEYHEEDCS